VLKPEPQILWSRQLGNYSREAACFVGERWEIFGPIFDLKFSSYGNDNMF
jgi:hypothetical protein